MNLIETEKMISNGIRRTEEEAEQFNRDYEAASQRIRDTKCKMKRHEYLLRDRRLGKPPDRSDTR
ncbi:hypothetical protein M3629_03765 [Paenibacillus polysaccharolyticus]|uniref:hypothetical protein n=1 Tax=Paenibacillus polysaccharolyticus TaxID=582692 RepID=UPI00204144FC|nr:hypothetical protein [Paenibacillus polysaccharolyticus]MCM3131885.1 hypothetical protein [Paenibacillus polysaccharolyticus]